MIRIKLLILAITLLSTLTLLAQKEPTMVLVKGGTFTMGSNKSEPDERPQHKVTLSNYYIGKYEITVKQYKEYCKATRKRMPANPQKEWYEQHDMARKPWVWKDNYPITNVTWTDAAGYCKWLSKKTGKKYALPTEAQWEFAAKGGTSSKKYKFSGGDNPKQVSWFDETTYEKGPMAVGRLKPNELGIYDMSGNVWEWCSDRYGRYSKGKQKNPKGPSKGSFRVIRGGSWYYVEEMVKVTTRDGPYPHYTNFNYGFRVVINP